MSRPNSSSGPSAPAAEPIASGSSPRLSQPSIERDRDVAHPLEDADGVGSNTPPLPKVHVKALVISGESHLFSFEPEITVGRMKELVWSMWPSQWTDPAQPPSPAYLRILHAGRILQDDTSLSSNNLPISDTASSPTVIHVSVRSFSIRAEDADPKKGLHPTRTRSRGRGNDEVGGCKCVIM